MRENIVVLCTDANVHLPCAFLIDQLMADPQGDEHEDVRRRVFARTASTAAQAPGRLAASRTSVAGMVATRRFIDLDPPAWRALVTAISSKAWR